MAARSEKLKKIHVLLDELETAGPDSDAARQLRRLLRDDPEACELYLDCVDLDVQLQCQFRGKLQPSGKDDQHMAPVFPPTPHYDYRLGRIPLLVLSIHDNIARSPKKPERSREYRTRELNEKLHLEFGSYFFNYSGYRNRCMKDGMPVIKSLVESMLEKHPRIAVLSLHRTNAYILKPNPNRICTLGCLHNHSLDPLIERELAKALAPESIVFTQGKKQIGGAEVQRLHKDYNDPRYDQKENRAGNYRLILTSEVGDVTQSPTGGHNPQTNTIQIVQVEFAWRVPNEESHDRPYIVCRALAQIMLDYVQRPLLRKP